MSKVTFWKATDGSLHETHQAFLEHEAKVKIAAAVERPIFQRGSFDTDEEGNECIYAAGLGSFIANNYKIIRQIIDDATAVKRPRKAKVAA